MSGTYDFIHDFFSSLSVQQKAFPAAPDAIGIWWYFRCGKEAVFWKARRYYVEGTHMEINGFVWGMPKIVRGRVVHQTEYLLANP